jgi:hypothetical protein
LAPEAKPVEIHCCKVGSLSIGDCIMPTTRASKRPQFSLETHNAATIKHWPSLSAGRDAGNSHPIPHSRETHMATISIALPNSCVGRKCGYGKRLLPTVIAIVWSITPSF